MPLLFAVFLFIGCNDDDDDNNDHDFHLEYSSVISTELPDEFTYGSAYEVKVTIELPSSCYHYYNEYDYIHDGTSRLIYPIVHIDEGVDCLENITETTFSIPLQVEQNEPYIFKFYQGKDTDEQDVFLIIEVPVV